MPELLLASSSPYRRQLLDRLGISYTALSPDIDESPAAGERGADLAARLGLAKARKIAEDHPSAAVIGSDQVAMLGDQILTKPGCRARARKQLRAASGRSVVFYTAVSICVGSDTRSHVDTTRVIFRALSTREIDSYLDKEQPYDCAGSFKAEGLGIALFERITSEDPTALQGLPLIWVAGHLMQLGVPLL